MPIDDKPTEDIESLIESGRFNDDTDVAVLAAALNGQLPSEAKTGDQEASPGDETVTTTDPADPAAATDTANADQEAGKADEHGDPTGDDTDSSSFRTHPLYGVLKGTRKTLADTKAQARAREQQLEQERDALRRQNEDLVAKAGTSTASKADLQQAVDDAGLVDRQGNPIDVATVDINKLREDYDGPLVEAIAGMQQVIIEQGKAITEMRQREQARTRTDEDRVAEEVQADIDSIPVLAEMQASNPSMWNAAIAVDQTLNKDPAWKGKSRLERFQEVARIFGGGAPAPTPKPTDKTKADAAVQKAALEAAARAVPTSLSELPSGTPAGQSEQETLESLSIEQLAVKMAGMTPAQQEALLARCG